MVMVFLVCNFISIVSSKPKYSNKTLRYYKEYMQVLEGVLTENSEKYIQEEYEKVVSTIEAEKQLANTAGTIDFDAVQYAVDHEQAFNMIYDRYEYLSGLEESNERVFYYDLDWNNYFKKTNFNYFELFILLIISLYAITMEFFEKRYEMVKTSYLGKRSFMTAKQSAVVIINIAVSLVVFLVEFMVISTKNGLDMLSLPARSMERFAKLQAGTTIGELLIISMLHHVLWCIVTTLFMMSIGLLVKKLHTGLFYGALSILLPISISSVFNNGIFVFFYGANIMKYDSLCRYGNFGIVAAIFMTGVAYIVNLLLWDRSISKE